MADNQKIREEVQALTTQLETGIQDLYSSDKYAAYLDTLAKFHNYSTRNTMLIHLQMPEATNVAGFNKWKNEFSRHVTKGQKGIRIFAPAPYIVKKEMEMLDPETKVPMLDNSGKPIVEEVDVTIPAFKAVSVFDVSQTDGQPLPSLAENLTGDVRQYEAFLDSLKDVSAMPIDFADMDENQDGECNYNTRAITVRSGMSEVQTIAAVVHEMTHAELHDYNEQLDLQEPESATDVSDDAEAASQKPRSRRAEEVEAESVSYVVCQHYGIETAANSFGYIAEWSKGQELNELKASLDIIRKTATSMIERIDSRFAEICKDRDIDLSAEKETVEPVVEQEEAQEIPTASEPDPEAAAPTQAPQRQFFITNRQREQAERMAEKWEARSEAFYAGGDGWGVDTVEYCKTPEEADKAVETAEKIRTSINNLSSGNGAWPDVQVIRQAVSARDELDAQVAANQDERPAASSKEEPVPEVDTEENTVPASRYTELQHKGFEIAKKYEKLPMQDRIKIIAETFGCKTASIRTSPCGGKWRGTSDISLEFDNGSSLGIGNYRTPQAKTAAIQNECVNNTLASYNPEILAEIKTKIMPALLKREAVDNEIAAQKGLKPYTLLNVELNDGSDKDSSGYLGWYYATVAVDGKIFALVETGLNYDIAKGELSESRSNYFVAGALKDNEADFVFDNVGHSSISQLYKLHLSDDARERAEKTLTERTADAPVIDSTAQEKEEREINLAPMPDPSIDVSERDLYGYTYNEMYPLLQERALELYDQDLAIYLLYPDGTESMAFDREEIENFDGIYGIESDSWQQTHEYEQLKSSLNETEAAKEATLLYGKDATYAIYQLKDGDETRNYRFEALDRLEARGLSVDSSNYELIYLVNPQKCTQK